MEPPRDTPPPWLPATRPPVPPPAIREPWPVVPVAPPGPEAATDPPGGRPSVRWRRLTRSRRGAAGLVIAVAALLLWPFSGWSWIPWAAGVGLLILLRLLRLDGLLRGWVLHLGGLAVVVGLMYSTGPWAWALAASVGVLLAGLAQLPWWRLAAVGAVLCVVSGIGFGFANYRDAQQVAALEAQTHLENNGRLGASRPGSVLPTMLNRIAQNSPGPVCDNLLADPARTAFVAASGQPDCAAAVASLASRVTDVNAYAGGRAPTTTADGTTTVDACAMTWSGTPAGPQLGKLTIGRKDGGSTYVVTAFAPC
ncbi:MAG: hypothetical protein QOG20_5839 [Pseudonocardiales bacterium]|jgi:hypothetical protein|nr:hypothetical protein [Pseudonocardiales bacterium]